MRLTSRLLPQNTNNISGTSMATPHIAGLVATLISRDGNSSPANISAAIQTLSTKGVLTGIREYRKRCPPVSQKLNLILLYMQPPARSTTSPATSLKLALEPGPLSFSDVG